MLDYPAALAKIFQACPLIGTQILDINDATLAGRVLAENLTAPHPMPKAAISAMDGYAIMAGNDTPHYHVIGESAAGRPFTDTVSKSEAVAIFTGALLPEGANCVVIKEECIISDDRLVLHEKLTPQAGDYIREAGLDFAKDEICLHQYQCLNPRNLALMAAMNISKCLVFTQPNISIISSGDELCKAGDAQEKWQIASSNDIALKHLLPPYGANIIASHHVKDDVQALTTYLQSQVTQADIVILTGGVSVGDYDLVAQSLAAIDDYQTIFHGVNLRPGKPTLFGKTENCLVFGLPGNPVSAFIGALLFIVPALQKMQGRSDENATPPIMQAMLACDLPSEGKRSHYRRAKIYQRRDNGNHGNATLYAKALPQQDSAQLKMLSEADGLILCPANSPAKKSGEIVDIILFSQIAQICANT
ncbi:MAG: molybdopterin molybdotransferase MoeA [Alphaproteobacteria bacterium]|nr:molybdopterin molybdotransferase MoeA [Alphaproteobacteria bacterium]